MTGPPDDAAEMLRHAFCGDVFGKERIIGLVISDNRDWRCFPCRRCGNGRCRAASWALSFSLRLQDLDLGPDLFCGDHARYYGDDLAGRLPRAAAAGRPVGVERLDLGADRLGRLQGRAPSGDPRPHLARHRRGAVVRALKDRVDPDQFAAKLLDRHTGQRQTLAHDLQRKSTALGGLDPGICDLALARVAVEIAYRTLSWSGGGRPRAPLSATASGPTSSSRTAEKSAVTSGVR